MTRPAAWLLLVVALAGPMLTHAEAAEDLARALMIAVGEPGGIETPDGGVGDDPNVAAVSRAGPTVDALQYARPALDAPWVVASVDDPPPLDPARRSNGCRTPLPLATAPARAAWLQVFRN